MEFMDIERKLTVIHEKRLIVPYFAPGFSMAQTAIRQILKHDNYRIDNLLDYVFSLGLFITLNTYVLITVKDLSYALSLTRQEYGILQKDLLSLIKEETPSFTPSRMCAVEKGRNFQRKTLLAYCAALEKIYDQPYKWELRVGSNSHLTDADIRKL